MQLLLSASCQISKLDLYHTFVTFYQNTILKSIKRPDESSIAVYLINVTKNEIVEDRPNPAYQEWQKLMGAAPPIPVRVGTGGAEKEPSPLIVVPAQYMVEWLQMKPPKTIQAPSTPL